MVESELTRIRTLLEVLTKDMQETKDKIGEIAELDKRVATIQAKYDAHIDQLSTLTHRVDELHRAKEEAESFIDKIKGAFILIGFLQAAIIGGTTWIVTQVIDTRQDMAVLQYSIDKQLRDQAWRAAPVEVPSDR